MFDPKNEYYDPKHDDFDPFECWDKVDCKYVDEMTYEDENGEIVYDGMYCTAPYEFECPLFAQRIKEDLEDVL